MNRYPYCNWCGDVLDLNDKYCCEHCLQMCVKQCVRCHKPYDKLEYFSDIDDAYCSACKVCMSRQKLQKAEKAKAEQEIYEVLKRSRNPSFEKLQKSKENENFPIEHEDFVLKHEYKGTKKCVIKRLTGEARDPKVPKLKKKKKKKTKEDKTIQQ